MRKYYCFVILLMLTAFLFSLSVPVKGAEKKAVYPSRHDETKYGKYLSAAMVKDSLPTCGVVINGNYLYTCGSRHVTIYDIAVPGKPRQIARITGLSNSCRQIAFYKNVLYVTARMDGLYIIDVKDPARPFILSRYDTIEFATGIKCDNDIAYVCQRQYGTEFIDISNPAKPRHLGFVISGEAQSVDSANGILYAGDWGSRKFSVFDVRNPKNPLFLGDAPIDGLGDGVYVRDKIGYAATGLVVFRPKSRRTPGEGNGLDIFSLEDVSAPKLLGRIKMPCTAFPMYPDLWSVLVDEKKTAYVNSTYNGLFCIDVSDPTRPTPIAHAVPWDNKKKQPEFIASLAVTDGVIYAAGYFTGLWTVPAPGIAQRLTERTNLPTPSGPVPSDPPVEKDIVNDFTVWKTNGQVCSVSVCPDGKRIWVAAGMAGIYLLDITGKTPQVVRHVPTVGFAAEVRLYGDRLFVAESENGFFIYETDKEGNLRQLGHYHPKETVRQAVIPDPLRWAIVKAGNSIHFLDISDPTSPRPVMRDSVSHGIMYGRELVDGDFPKGYAATLWWSFGFAWYDLSGEKPVKLGIKEMRASFFEGGCFYKDKMWYFPRGQKCYAIDPGDMKPLSENISYPVKNLTTNGKSFIADSLAGIVHRRNGIIAKVDIKDPTHPKLVKIWKIKGHPDQGAFINGKLVVPCGYAGLLIEK